MSFLSGSALGCLIVMGAWLCQTTLRSETRTGADVALFALIVVGISAIGTVTAWR